MGYILEWMFPCFDSIMKKGYLKDPMAQIGSQQVYGSSDGRTPKQIFKERYNINDYTDFDINDKARVKLDLTEPLPEEYKEKYNTIVDSGTMEHIFDQKNAFTNFYEMCKVRGYIIHIQTIRFGWNHGFYNYCPCTFCKLANANKYPIIHTAFIYRVAGTDEYVYTEKFKSSDYLIGHVNPFSPDPSAILFVIVMEKASNNPLKMPMDAEG